MIAVIKYKAGNLASVANALNRLEAPFFLASTPQELESSRAVIFPGVGHAGAAMDSLKELELDQWLRETTKPVLGICVGMQLLFEGSDEGNTEGLGVIPGRLKRFPGNLRRLRILVHKSFRVGTLKILVRPRK